MGFLLVRSVLNVSTHGKFEKWCDRDFDPSFFPLANCRCHSQWPSPDDHHGLINSDK